MLKKCHRDYMLLWVTACVSVGYKINRLWLETGLLELHAGKITLWNLKGYLKSLFASFVMSYLFWVDWRLPRLLLRKRTLVCSFWVGVRQFCDPMLIFCAKASSIQSWNTLLFSVVSCLQKNMILALGAGCDFSYSESCWVRNREKKSYLHVSGYTS